MRIIIYSLIIGCIVSFASGSVFADPSADYFDDIKHAIDFNSEHDKIFIWTWDYEDQPERYIFAIQIADPWTLDVEKVIPVDGMVYPEILMIANNLIFVVSPYPPDPDSEHESYLRKIDLKSGKTIKELPFKYLTRGATADSGKEFIYTGSYYDTYDKYILSKINIENFSVIESREFDKSGWALPLVLSRDEKRIYSVTDELRSFSTDDLSILTTFETKLRPDIIGAGNNNRLYVHQGTKIDPQNRYKHHEEILVIDCTDDQVVKTIDVDDYECMWAEINPVDNSIYLFSPWKCNPDATSFENSREPIRTVLEIDPNSGAIKTHTALDNIWIDNMNQAILVTKPGTCRIISHRKIDSSSMANEIVVFNVY